MSPYTDKGILIEEYWKSWHIWCWLQVVWHTNHFHIFVFGWWRPPYPNGHQANFALICYPTERSSSWHCDQNPFIQSSKWHSILHLLLFRFLLTVRQHCGIPSIASRDFWYLPSGRVDSLKSAERWRRTWEYLHTPGMFNRNNEYTIRCSPPPNSVHFWNKHVRVTRSGNRTWNWLKTDYY